MEAWVPNFAARRPSARRLTRPELGHRSQPRGGPAILRLFRVRAGHAIFGGTRRSRVSRPDHGRARESVRPDSAQERARRYRTPGYFDGDFDFIAEVPLPPPPPGMPNPFDAPFGSVFAVLPDQLGLKLESTRAPVDVLVIDSVERPAPE